MNRKNCLKKPNIFFLILIVISLFFAPQPAASEFGDGEITLYYSTWWWVHDVDTEITISATVHDFCDPYDVTFTIVSGPHAGLTSTVETGLWGHADFTYTGTTAGIDVIEATYVDCDGNIVSNQIQVEWSDEPKIIALSVNSDGLGLRRVEYEMSIAGRLVERAYSNVVDAYVEMPVEENVDVIFTIISGPHAGLTSTVQTELGGWARFTYTGTSVGTDVIEGTFVSSEGSVTADQTTVIWSDQPIYEIEMHPAPDYLMKYLVGTQESIHADVYDITLPIGQAIENIDVTFTILSGPHTGLTYTVQTGGLGETKFTYTGASEGTDSIEVSFFDEQGNIVTSSQTTIRWLDQPVVIDLSQSDDAGLVDTQHDIFAQLVCIGRMPLDGTISFTIISGPHAGLTNSVQIDRTGNARFTYTGTSEGTDVIETSFVDWEGNTITSNQITMTWEAPQGTPIFISESKGTVYFDPSQGTIQDITHLSGSLIPEAPPSEANFYYGLFKFNIVDVAPGTGVGMTLRFPDNLPTGTTYWKYGPTIETPTPHWYEIPCLINGNKLFITLTDGGNGDDDLIVNGRINDDGGPSIPQTPEPIPEFPTLTIPVIIVIGLLFLFSKRK